MKKYETELSNDLGTPGQFKTIDLNDEPKIEPFLNAFLEKQPKFYLLFLLILYRKEEIELKELEKNKKQKKKKTKEEKVPVTKLVI